MIPIIVGALWIAVIMEATEVLNETIIFIPIKVQAPVHLISCTNTYPKQYLVHIFKQEENRKVRTARTKNLKIKPTHGSIILLGTSGWHFQRHLNRDVCQLLQSNTTETRCLILIVKPPSSHW